MKPKLFIGSSKEGLEVARAIETQLEKDVEATVWEDGVFGLGRGTLESLAKALDQFDYAVLVLSPDDMTISRKNTSPSPRDNILLELGMFIGRIGRERTFIVYNRDVDIKLPSDLAGVTVAEFGNRDDNNIIAALGPACTKIRYAIKSFGTFSFQSNWIAADGIANNLMRPVVIAKVEIPSQGNTAAIFDLVVHNTGNAPAKNIRLSIDQIELETAFAPQIDEVLKDTILKCFTDEGIIPVLENGQYAKCARNSFGVISVQPGHSTWKNNAILNIKISYQDLDGNPYEYELPLKIGDNSSFAGGAWSKV